MTLTSSSISVHEIATGRQEIIDVGPAGWHVVQHLIDWARAGETPAGIVVTPSGHAWVLAIRQAGDAELIGASVGRMYLPSGALPAMWRAAPAGLTSGLALSAMALAASLLFDDRIDDDDAEVQQLCRDIRGSLGMLRIFDEDSAHQLGCALEMLERFPCARQTL